MKNQFRCRTSYSIFYERFDHWKRVGWSVRMDVTSPSLFGAFLMTSQHHWHTNILKPKRERLPKLYLKPRVWGRTEVAVIFKHRAKQGLFKNSLFGSWWGFHPQVQHLNYHSHTAKADCMGTNNVLSLSLPESVMDTFKRVLTFESEDEIVWFDLSNETSLAVL